MERQRIAGQEWLGVVWHRWAPQDRSGKAWFGENCVARQRRGRDTILPTQLHDWRHHEKVFAEAARE